MLISARLAARQSWRSADAVEGVLIALASAGALQWRVERKCHREDAFLFHGHERLESGLHHGGASLSRSGLRTTSKSRLTQHVNVNVLPATWN